MNPKRGVSTQKALIPIFPNLSQPIICSGGYFDPRYSKLQSAPTVRMLNKDKVILTLCTRGNRSYDLALRITW